MFLKRGQFGFVYHRSKVVALQIVIGNMFHVYSVEKPPGNSQKETIRFDVGWASGSPRCSPGALPFHGESLCANPAWGDGRLQPFS